MDKSKIIETKRGLKPFLKRLKQQKKPLYAACIKPLLYNNSTTPFTLEVQAEWIDSMSTLEAIQYLFSTLRETNTDESIMNSIFAIRVVRMRDDIECDKPYHALVSPLSEGFAA